MSMNVEELTHNKVSEKFPNILIQSPNDTLPIIVRTLEKGDMQLIVEFKGRRKVVMSVSSSAYNINKLIRTNSPILYQKSTDCSVELTDVTTYLSCL